MLQSGLPGCFQLCVSSDHLRIRIKEVNMDVDRLPWKAARRTLILGLIMGSSIKMLSLGKEQLQGQADILSKSNKNEGEEK